MKISDEILNKYIDGELDSAALEEIRDQLKNSEEERKRLAELQAVHANLKKIPADEVSPGFTEKVMMKLREQRVSLPARSKWVKEQSRFVFGVSSIFLLICFLIFGYLLYSFVSASDDQKSSADYSGLVDNFANGMVNFIMSINLSIIGSILSAVILISAYFFFEAMKKSRERFN
jgi:anti-sigma factor RsiW